MGSSGVVMDGDGDTEYYNIGYLNTAWLAVQLYNFIISK